MCDVEGPLCDDSLYDIGDALCDVEDPPYVVLYDVEGTLALYYVGGPL